MLLSTCVLCAKCKVRFSVLQLHICPCKTWVIMKKDWLPSRNLKFSKLLPPTHTHPQPRCCEDYESFLLEQSLKPKLSLQLLNNLHILAPLPHASPPENVPSGHFLHKLYREIWNPFLLKQVCTERRGRGETLSLFNQYYHFWVC